MTGSTILAQNVTFRTNVDKQAEMQVLTNVPYVYDIEQEYIASEHPNKLESILNKNKKSKFHTYLVYDAASPQNEPFFVTHYHGNSDSAKLRDEELTQINTEIKALSQYVQSLYGIKVRDYVLMGDFNRNMLKHALREDGDDDVYAAVVLKRKALKKVIALAGQDAQIQMAALPEGMMSKQRGVLGRPYNLYLNPQAEKNLDFIANDSKDLVLCFRLNDPEQAHVDVDVDDFLNRLEASVAGSELKTRDFLKEFTHFRDHFGSTFICFNGVWLKVDSYLPTEGPKKVKDPTKYFNEPRIQNLTPEELAALRVLQEEATGELFSLLAKALNVALGEGALSTNESIRQTLKTLNEAIAAQFDPQNPEQLRNLIAQALTDWMATGKYQAAANLLNEDKKAEVLTKMQKLISEELKTKIVDVYVEDKKKAPEKQKFDFISKVIQLCGQCQCQEMSGGYAFINNVPFPGPEQVDRHHVLSTFLGIDYANNQSFYWGETESGTNKAAQFYSLLNEAIANLPVNFWIGNLDQYWDDRCEKYKAKDALCPADAQVRSEQIAELKTDLKKLSKIKILPADVTAPVEELELTEWSIACTDLIQKIHEMKARFPGREFRKILNQISAQIQFHYAAYINRDEEQDCSVLAEAFKNATKDKSLRNQDLLDESTQVLADLETCYAKMSAQVNPEEAQSLLETKLLINQVKNCYKKIEAFESYTKPDNALSPRYQAIKFNLILNIRKNLNNYLKDHMLRDEQQNLIGFQRPSKEDLDQFKYGLAAMIHSQDPVMSQHRSNSGRVADIILAILTLGIIHLAKALIEKAVTGAARFGIFHQDTTRVKRLDALDQEVCELGAGIAF